MFVVLMEVMLVLDITVKTVKHVQKTNLFSHLINQNQSKKYKNISLISFFSFLSCSLARLD